VPPFSISLARSLSLSLALSLSLSLALSLARSVSQRPALARTRAHTSSPPLPSRPTAPSRPRGARARAGSIFTKYTHGRVGAFKSPKHEIKLWVAQDRLVYRNLTKARGLSRAALAGTEKATPLAEITDVIAGPRSQVFNRHGVSARLGPADADEGGGSHRSRGATPTASAAGASSGGGAARPAGPTDDDAYFSLVFSTRTLDLQAETAELGDFWARFFKQIVQRSRLEETARRIAEEAQPRERRLEVATQFWADEVLPRWSAEHVSERARRYWWTGLPPAVRGAVWTNVLREASARPADAAAAARALDPRAHGKAALAAASDWLDASLPLDNAELRSLYGCARAGAGRNGPTRARARADPGARGRAGARANSRERERDRQTYRQAD
jgi:hypothetical protein